MRWALYFCGLPPQNGEPQSNCDRSQTEGYSTEYLMGAPLNCHGHQKQENEVSCQSPKEAMETQMLN